MKKVLITVLTLCLTGAVMAQTVGDLPFTTSLKELYQEADQRLARASSARQPIVGISTYEESGKTQVNTVYVKAVEQAGGIPVLLPFTCQPELVAASLRQVDALILTGGADAHPLLFGEEPIRQLGSVQPKRDVYDLLLLHIALQQGVPILGICRGEQICNVGLGGTLFQDLPAQKKGALMHRQSIPAAVGAHTITVEPDSRLYRILGGDTFEVNSFHHQAVKEVAPGLKVTARAVDGVVEAIEGFPTYNLLAVQFHPEHLVAGDQKTIFLPIFKDLIERAVEYKASNKR